MSFPWIEMRISEEKDRRQRELDIMKRLPRAMRELHDALAECTGAYARAFGSESAEIVLRDGKIQVVTREEIGGSWRQRSQVEITAIPTLPGFRVECGGESFQIEVGTLPGDKLFHKYQEQYLTLDQLTRRVLDRVLFPKLGE